VRGCGLGGAACVIIGRPTTLNPNNTLTSKILVRMHIFAEQALLFTRFS
jgi:hypothetical protein